MIKAKDVLRRINFDWTRHIDSVWGVNRYDIAEIHKGLREELIEALAMVGEYSALGEVVVGPAGSGKTHFVGALRQHMMADEAFFVLIDMTDVHDFWDTVRLGYLDSFNRTDHTDEPQFRRPLSYLLSCLDSVKEPQATLHDLREMQSERLISKYVDRHVLGVLHRKFGKPVQRYKDVIRALFLINADDFTIRDVGDSWLQGIGIEDDQRDHYSFASNQPEPKLVVEGLSWLFSLVAPALVAFDQLDAIVAQHHVASLGVDPEQATQEERVSASIIEGVAGGLMAMRDATRRSLCLVSCLEVTWNILQQRAVAPFADRFHLPERRLPLLTNQQLGRQLVMERVREACESQDFNPPDEHWPFAANVFNNMPQMLPRELLKACDKARRLCLQNHRDGGCDPFSLVDDPGSWSAADVEPLQRRFLQMQGDAPLERILDHENEDSLADGLIEAACRCLVKEHPCCDQVDFVVDEDFGNSQRSASLHVRIRLVFHNEGSREQHFSFRVMHKNNANAFQSRLKSAVTAAGIDQRLGYRRLILIRREEIPGGKVTANLWQNFLAHGGLVIHLNDDQWRAIWALAELEKEDSAQFEAWLKGTQPVRQMALFTTCKLGEALDRACSGEPNEKSGAEQSTDTDTDASKSKNADITSGSTPQQTGDAVSTPPPTGVALLIGPRLHALANEEMVTVPLKQLTRHVVALAGSGSGKTVLVRRLVEMAALGGVPSIVIDPANDLARLGDAWDGPQAHWIPGDAERASRYFEQSEVRVWTPGKASGRPMVLSPLPNLAAVADDADELNAAIGLAQEALGSIVAQGTSAAANTKRGVLVSSLRYLAKQGGGDLNRLVNLLSELPIEASGGISNAERLGLAMADQLRAAMQTDPLLRGKGEPLDPSELFGLNRERTRVSVINLHGLPTLANQQRFIGQLAMALFTWIKQHPAPAEFPIRGLLVIDEAKDFVPSSGVVASKAPLMRLASQARKYGLGLIFATQAPKSIHHEIIANCTTHFYGKANSPAAIDVIREQLRQRGTSGQDVPTLKRGQFYVYSEGFPQPVKVAVPICLTKHAATPLSEDEVVQRAKG